MFEKYLMSKKSTTVLGKSVNIKTLNLNTENPVTRNGTGNSRNNRTDSRNNLSSLRLPNNLSSLRLPKINMSVSIIKNQKF